MTAAQSTISLNSRRQPGGLLAAVAAGLVVAVIAVAISARPVVAPASTPAEHAQTYVKSLLGHDSHALNLPPTPHYRDVTAPRQPAEIFVPSPAEQRYQAAVVVAEHAPAPQTFVARDVVHPQTLPRKPSLPNATRLGGPHKGR